MDAATFCLFVPTQRFCHFPLQLTATARLTDSQPLNLYSLTYFPWSHSTPSHLLPPPPTTNLCFYPFDHHSTHQYPSHPCLEILSCLQHQTSAMRSALPLRLSAAIAKPATTNPIIPPLQTTRAFSSTPTPNARYGFIGLGNMGELIPPSYCPFCQTEDPTQLPPFRKVPQGHRLTLFHIEHGWLTR